MPGPGPVYQTDHPVTRSWLVSLSAKHPSLLKYIAGYNGGLETINSLLQTVSAGEFMTVNSTRQQFPIQVSWLLILVDRQN
ncbi:MAG: hypothetical protein CMJ81_08970 [Planctomycetaceae bacterium]|nr:hypothetical protein [Planctomycetaceae bacterium]